MGPRNYGFIVCIFFRNFLIYPHLTVNTTFKRSTNSGTYGSKSDLMYKCRLNIWGLFVLNSTFITVLKSVGPQEPPTPLYDTSLQSSNQSIFVSCLYHLISSIKSSKDT